MDHIPSSQQGHLDVPSSLLDLCEYVQFLGLAYVLGSLSRPSILFSWHPLIQPSSTLRRVPF